MTDTVTTTVVLSAYAVHKMLNAALEEAGSDRQIRPQMVYNYSTNGLIVKGAKKGPQGDHTYSVEDAEAWIAKFVAKNA